MPPTITHGEDGERLPDMSGVALHHTPIEEDDEELVRADSAQLHGEECCRGRFPDGRRPDRDP